MAFASTNGGGQCSGFPDTCKTPSPGGPVPMPYTNLAQLTQARGGTCSKKVRILNKKTLTKNSEIAMSSGNEAGSAGGGVVSSKIKGPARFKQGSAKVLVEGKPIAYHTAMVGMNGDNVPAGKQVAPSQTKVDVRA